jgi:exonuclease VII large subunit
VSAAEKLHLTAVQQLTHRSDIPKGSWPEKLERVTVLSPDNSKAVTDIQAVIENKGKGTIQLPKFTRIPVSMNRHTVAENLVKALAAIDQGSVDLILITRGGGHWTDLWSFNDPELARAIHQCPVPVMVAIGHAADHTSNAERLAVDCFSTPTAFGHELVRKLYARNGARKPRAATVPAPTSRTASTQTQLDAQRERCRELEQMNAVNSSHAKERRSAFLNELHASGTARVKNHWATVALVATLAGVIAAMIATAKSEDLPAPTVILVATAVITALCWRHRRQADAPPRPTRTRTVPVDTIEWINAARKARTPRRHRAVWAQVPASLTNP